MDNIIVNSEEAVFQELNKQGKPTKGGRGLKIKTAQTLKKKIDTYFEACQALKLPYTMSGLALSLGVSRQTLLRWEGEDIYGYGNLIEKAKTEIEHYSEKRLYERNCIGAIFALKNNFPGWMERTETKLSGPLGSILDQIQNGKEQKSIVKGKALPGAIVYRSSAVESNKESSRGQELETE